LKHSILGCRDEHVVESRNDRPLGSCEHVGVIDIRVFTGSQAF
jgi:hypothetical protein